MSPTRRLLIGAIVLLAAAGGYAAGRAIFRPSEQVLQPIAFNHAKHAGELELPCNTCHHYYEISRHSGLPSLTICMDCHEGSEPGNAEIDKLVALAGAGETQVFRKLFRLPDHAFYSHRRHVKVAEIPCETCHGEIAKTTVPPRTPLVRITMDFCLDCHRQKMVRSDCTSCHS